MKTILIWLGDTFWLFVVLGVHEQWIKPWSMRFVSRVNYRIRKVAPLVFEKIDPILAQLLLTKQGDELDQTVRAFFAEVSPEYDWSEVDLQPFYDMLDVRKVADHTPRFTADSIRLG